MSRTGLVSLAVGLAVALALLATNDPAAIWRLLAGAGWGVLLVVALHGPQVVFSALGWQPLILDPRRPSLPALIRLRWIREGANALLPLAAVGGELVRGQLLLRRDVTRARTVASIAVDMATEMGAQIVFSLLGIAVLAAVPHSGATDVTRGLLGATLFGALLALGFVAAQRWGLFRMLEQLLPAFAARAGWRGVGDLVGLNDAAQALYRQPRRLSLSAAAHLLSWLLGVGETWAALWVLGLDAGLAEVLVIESLTQALRSAGFFVPGALGVAEGGTILLCGLFGIPPEGALALALLRRLRDVVLGIPALIAWRREVARPALAPALAGDTVP